jgi:hypothetical protein
LRQRWLNQFGANSLIYPADFYNFKHSKITDSKANNFESNGIHIVIEVRSINPAKKNNHSSARHIRNLAQLISSLQSISTLSNTTSMNFNFFYLFMYYSLIFF